MILFTVSQAEKAVCDLSRPLLTGEVAVHAIICTSYTLLQSYRSPALGQDLVEVLSRPDTWKTALKHDQAAYQRNADGSYKVGRSAGAFHISCCESACLIQA